MKEFIEKLIARIVNSVGKEIALSFSTIGEWNAYRTGCAYKQNQIIDIVNQLAEEHNNGWIPCSERLPEDGQCVFVQVRDSIQLDTNDETPIQIRKYETKHDGFSWKQIGYDEWLRNDIVLAWQPLPAPYKGEQK